jgi:uncharacterized protein YutE (UPF0331/DUF86 family)
MTTEFMDRLVKHIQFIEEELKDHEQFKSFTRDEYLKNRNKRRDLERWIENIVNSTVDISRIILSIEGKPIPDTYREVVQMISTVDGLQGVEADKLSKWVKLRNIISHEYLDIRWSSISKFIAEVEMLYKEFVPVIKRYGREKLNLLS